MKRLLSVLALMASVVLASFSPASALIDVVEYDTAFFTPPGVTSGSYYRYYDQDWGWQHSVISGSFTSATLSISAWDVDRTTYQSQPEFDEILVKKNGTLTSIGFLEGATDVWSYTTFTLDSSFFDDIKNGLEVWIDIDTTHTSDYWAVALAKSVLTLDGGTLPDPEPGNPVPEPSTLLLLGAGLAGLGFARKRLTKK